MASKLNTVCKATAAIYVCTYVCYNEPATLLVLCNRPHRICHIMQQHVTKMSKIGNHVVANTFFSTLRRTFPAVEYSHGFILKDRNVPNQRPKRPHGLLKPTNTITYWNQSLLTLSNRTYTISSVEDEIAIPLIPCA